MVPTAVPRAPSCALAAALVAGLIAASAGAQPRAASAPLFTAADSVLDLAVLERAALERNASYAAATAAAREAVARADAAGALAPLELGAGLAPSSVGSAAGAGWRASVSQPLPLFGRRGLERRMARGEAGAVQGDADAARLDLLRQVRAAFYDDYHADRVRQTALETLAWMRRARAAALARYAAGTAPQQDVFAADVEIAMLEHQAVSAGRNRLLVEARLRAMLHLDPASPLPAPPDTLSVPDADDARLLLMRSNERTRPELRGAEARVDAQRARLALARRAALPELSAGWEYDRTMDEPAYRSMATLTLELPVWPGRVAAERRAAEAGLAEATAQRDAARDELLRRITDASTQFDESLHELGVIGDALLPAAERSLASARAGYESGRGDFGAVIRAERDVLGARLEVHRTLAAVHQARAELERALGGPSAATLEEGR